MGIFHKLKTDEARPFLIFNLYLVIILFCYFPNELTLLPLRSLAS